MIFTETRLKDAYILELEKLQDERGFFARGYCSREFASHGLVPRVVQSNVSFNLAKGTLRGLHYQVMPYVETKLVRCTKGAIYDVIIDLRPESKTFRQWTGVELTEENYRMLYVPGGFAHGFQTLEDRTEVIYHVSEFYVPKAEQGIRYNDPAFDIRWPLEVQVISQKDNSWPHFSRTAKPATEEQVGGAHAS
jgi:dTDP-4-dehydrorhamnose 3,5-epimerase